MICRGWDFCRSETEAKQIIWKWGGEPFGKKRWNWQQIEQPHDKKKQKQKKNVRPNKTQIILGIRPVWSESSLCAQLVAKDPSYLHADSEDSGQTERMPRVIWVFAGRTVILLVLSWGGSDSVWLSLFMRDTEKCNSLHGPYRRHKRYSVFISLNSIVSKDQQMK